MKFTLRRVPTPSDAFATANEPDDAHPVRAAPSNGAAMRAPDSATPHREVEPSDPSFFILALAVRRWCRTSEQWERVVAVLADCELRQWGQECLAYSQQNVGLPEVLDLLEKIVAQERSVPAWLARRPEVAGRLAEVVNEHLRPLSTLIGATPMAYRALTAKALWRWEALFGRPRLVLGNGLDVPNLEAHLHDHPEDASLALRLLPVGEDER